MQDRTEIDRLAFVHGDVFNSAWSGAAVGLTLLVTVNGLLAGAASLGGGDWRNLVPSACLGALVAQHVVCAIYVVWGSGSLVARVVLNCLAVWLTAPVLAMSIRPSVAWADLKECLAALFICATVLTTAFAAARLVRFRIQHLPSTSRPTQVHWWFLCVWLAIAMSLRPRVTGLADAGEGLKVLVHCAIILGAVVAGVRLLSVRVRWPPSTASLPQPQWSLLTIFSITTVLSIWLGMAIGLDPFTRGFRYGPVRWGTMLASDVLWIPPLWTALAERKPQATGWAIAPFILAPALVLISVILEIGQAGDVFVQGWLAGPHEDKPGVDVMLRSGFGACVTVSEVEVALITAFLALSRRGGGRE